MWPATLGPAPVDQFGLHGAKNDLVTVLSHPGRCLSTQVVRPRVDAVPTPKRHTATRVRWELLCQGKVSDASSPHRTRRRRIRPADGSRAHGAERSASLHQSRRRKKPALSGRVLSDVCEPALVRSGGSKRAAEEVVREHDRAGLRTPPSRASDEPLKDCRRHMAGDALAADRPPEPRAHSSVTRGTP